MPTVRALALDSNIFSTNEKLVDMDPVLQKEYPEVTPLLTIFNKLAEDSAKNETIYWSNKPEIPTSITYSGAQEASAPAVGISDLTFDNWAYLREDQLLSCPRTGEGILVKVTPTSSTVSVYRGWDGTTGALNANEVLIFLPPSKEEGADYITPRSVVSTEDYNYVQEFDHFCQLSTLADLESTHFGGPGSKWKQMVKDTQREWAIMMENGLWLGVRAKTLISGESGYRRSFKGTNSWLAAGTNTENINGPLTEATFNAKLRKMVETFADKTRATVFCSPLVYGVFSNWGRSKLQTSPRQTTYGLRVDEYIGDLDVDLIRAPLWSDATRRGWLFALDMDRIKMKYMAHPRLNPDAAPETANYKLAKLYTAMTLMFANEAAHMKLYGITG